MAFNRPLTVCRICYSQITKRDSCLGEDAIFHRISAISLEKCKEECGKRNHCKAVNYRRNFQFCELLREDHGYILNEKGNQRSCEFVKKSDMSTDDLQACNCADWTTCDLETNTCRITECLRLELENGRILGNMMSVGSRVKFTCNTGYVEMSGEKYAVCETTGQWSYQPKCIREQTIGSTCTADSNCSSLTGGQCVENKCFCSPLYRYNDTINDCFQVCTSFNNILTAIPNTYIHGYNDIAFMEERTLSECRTLCQEDPKCLSFEVYEIHSVSKCSRGSVTYGMVYDADSSSLRDGEGLYSRDCVMQ